MALPPKVLAKLRVEEQTLRNQLRQHGLLDHLRTETQVHDLMVSLHLSIPQVMARWDQGDPLYLLLCSDGDTQGSLLYVDPVAYTDKYPPLMFALQDYIKVQKAHTEDQSELPIVSAATGFFGECIRGTTAGQQVARYYLSEFMRLLFPDQTQVLLQVAIDATPPVTLTVDGYFYGPGKPTDTPDQAGTDTPSS